MDDEKNIDYLGFLLTAAIIEGYHHGFSLTELQELLEEAWKTSHKDLIEEGFRNEMRKVAIDVIIRESICVE